MENKIYNWFVKNGNILIQKNEDYISLQVSYERDFCLLTQSDADEVIEILISLSRQIWENPNYERKPYSGQLFKELENKYYWEIDTSELFIQYNDTENAIEIKCNGNSTLNLEINYVVEIIQILEHLNK